MYADKIMKLHKGHSIDAKHQIFTHLAQRFQRRRFSNVSANQKQELALTAMFSIRSGQNKATL